MAGDRPQAARWRSASSALAPIIRSAELGHSRKAVRHRLDRLTSELGLDRERARLWTIGSTIAWAFGGPPTHVETARWLL